MRGLLFGLAAIAAVMAVGRTPAAAVVDSARLEAFVDKTVRAAMANQHVAGAAVAVVDSNGPLLLKGYGIAGHGRLVGADTLFRVGSISKTITWIAIEQLVAEHRLNLDDPVNEHLPPKLRIPDEGFSAPIRVRNLMAHNAGFEEAILGVNVTQVVSRAQTLQDYIERRRPHRVRPPGQVAVYSNFGAALAGAIVEHETGMSFVDYVQANILRPLGMPTATFREPYPAAFETRGFPAPMPPEIAARTSSGFRFEDGRYVEQSWDYLPQMAPAGAMSAGARDMAVYMHALLVPDLFAKAHVLDTRSERFMRTPLFANDPRLGANLHGFWQIPTRSGALAFGHNGAMAFHQADMAIYPAHDLGIFVAINSGSPNGGNAIIADLPRQIVEQFFAGPKAKRVSNGGDDAENVEGCYKPLRRPYHRSERALFEIGLLQCVDAKANGDISIAKNTYIPVGNGVYARPDLSNKVAFAMRGERMTMFDYSSAGPSERVTFFEGPYWLALVGGLAAFVAAFRLAAGAVRVARRKETALMLLMDATGLFWLAGMALLAAAVWPWLADSSLALLNYPGALFPTACWAFLVAAIASAGAAAALVLRPQQGLVRHRRTGAVLSLLVYCAFAATLASHGLLGFTRW